MKFIVWRTNKRICFEVHDMFFDDINAHDYNYNECEHEILKIVQL